MHIAIVTDAWSPQVNGVVRTLATVKGELEKRGHVVEVIAPDQFRTIPCPTYPEIRLAILPGRGVRRRLDAMAPDAIHVATEGPLGMAARAYCRRRRLAFTTSFHTRFPEYVEARTGLPRAWLYAWMRRFHAPAAGVMVATDSLMRELAGYGFRNLRRWSRGVDTELFHPGPKDLYDLPRPIFLNVGRVAVEKNIEAFLDLDLPGTKVVVGDGPQRAQLERRYPRTVFLGTKKGADLARHFAAADVFVFPSRTDTFGLVLLEALAAGVPVAAFPVPGPLDVIDGNPVGVLDEDLGHAARSALAIPADRCRAYAEIFSWDRCAEQFLTNLAPVR
ncbi:GDP-mannose-dependent alpha-mannosyltransferase [Allostella vacuolata]|nr:GDP-mannose-dependent alpha-mannosyltransferase [Stella vacuolata]